MLSRKRYPIAPELLRKRQYAQWRAAIGIGVPRGSMKTSAGFKFPCWICGEEGILGVDGFGSKGIVRPRNVMHEACYEGLTTEQLQRYRHTDTKHILFAMQRRRARRSLDRESKKEAKWQRRHKN